MEEELLDDLSFDLKRDNEKCNTLYVLLCGWIDNYSVEIKNEEGVEWI